MTGTRCCGGPWLWHQIAAGFTVETLLDQPPSVTIGADAAEVVAQALAGTASIWV